MSKFVFFKKRFEDIDSISIFIQMELCKGNLGDYLESRNKNIFKKNSNSQKDSSYLLNKEEILKMLKFAKSLALGLDYIHNNQNLIHRDIKPKNIFFNDDDQIRIGDLGLATQSLTKKYSAMQPSPINRSVCSLNSSNNSNEKEEVANCSINSSLNNSFELDIVESDPIDNLNIEETHTSNIGTMQYAAPEQLSDNKYDQKVDIFSLGLVFFEMFYPLRTYMEKVDKQTKLKTNNELPLLMEENIPHIAALIKKMCSSQSFKRPIVNEVLSEIENLLVMYSDYEFVKSKTKNVIAFSQTNSIKNPNNFGLDATFKNKRARFLSDDVKTFQISEIFMKTESEPDNINNNNNCNEWKKV